MEIKTEIDDIGTAISCSNSDLSSSQLWCSCNASNKGSVRIWNNKDAPIINAQNHATGKGSFSTTIGASVSIMTSKGAGLGFNAGNHQFEKSDGATRINSIRMYMKAILIPVSILTTWGINDLPLITLPV